MRAAIRLLPQRSPVRLSAISGRGFWCSCCPRAGGLLWQGADRHLLLAAFQTRTWLSPVRAARQQPLGPAGRSWWLAIARLILPHSLEHPKCLASFGYLEEPVGSGHGAVPSFLVVKHNLIGVFMCALCLLWATEYCGVHETSFMLQNDLT